VYTIYRRPTIYRGVTELTISVCCMLFLAW